jgi:hypothetical protein
MTTREEEFGRKIKTYLDAAHQDLKSGTRYRLQQARAAALARIADPVRATELAVAGGGHAPGSDRPFYAQVRFWIGVALIALAAVGWQQWQAYEVVQDAEEIDAQLLSSDLPIDAYLDRGFQVWLRTAAQR